MLRHVFRSLLVMGLLALLSGSAFAQSAPLKYLSTNTTNATLVFGKQSFMRALFASNTTATIYYLKIYDKATQPVCGTDTPKWTIPLPPAATGSANGVPADLGSGLTFANGIGFCITGGIADNDTTAAAAGIVIDLGVSGR